MKWFAIIGLVLFIGVAVAPNINANIRDQGEKDIINENGQYQGQMKLIIGIINYIEEKYESTQSNEDCECEVVQPLWNYPVFCTLLMPLFYIGALFIILGLPGEWARNIGEIAGELNCWWAEEYI